MEVELKFLFFNSITLFSCLGLLINAHNFERDKQGVSFAKFVKASSVKLKVQVDKLVRLKVSTVGECNFECINNPKCYSVNFGTLSGDGKHVCELLKKDRFRQAAKVEASSDFDHYFIRTPCMSSPCLNGGTCRPIYSEDNYSCGCKEGFGGKHCQKESACKSSPCLNGATCEPIYSKDEYKCSCVAGFIGKQCEVKNWIQMTPSSVCFGARGDSFGTFTSPVTGSVITLKLIYQGGNIHCAVFFQSHWGCYHPLIPAGYNMATHITDSQKNRLLPKDEFMADVGSGNCVYKYYYRLPGLTANSQELVFDNFPIPRHVLAGERFQIWHGEDLGNCWEFDNYGVTCVEVYGLFV